MIKNQLHITTFLLFTLLLFYRTVLCQEMPSSPERPLKEDCFLITDRSLYISGESINFSALIIADTKEPIVDFSKILYVEIIDPNGKRISGSKYFIQKRNSNGSIQIPENTLTGIYYLKAYTKWMRNFKPETFCTASIKIINPYNEETINTESVDTNTTKKSLALNPIEGFYGIDFSLSKNSSRPRKSVTIKINDSIDFLKTISLLTISVVPETAYSNNTASNTLSNGFSGKFLPETRGLSISGKVLNHETREPLPNEKISVSLMNNYNYYNSNYTDSLGKFYFSFPKIEGSQFVLFRVESNNNLRSNIILDPDFSEVQTNILSKKFTITKEEQNTAIQLSVNQQILKHYGILDSTYVSNKSTNQTITFYQNPTFTIVFDEYVSLPSISEYFHEFTPSIQITKSLNKRFISLTYNQQKLSQPPLILLDGFPVFDVDKVLDIPPDLIKKIEIVNSTYFIGNMVYGGIVSIFSKKSDFAGIDFDPNCFSFNFQFLQPTIPQIKLNFEDKNEPFVKNNLLWIPNINLNKKSLEFSFITVDNPGKYLVVFKGVSNEKKVLTTTIPFEIF